MTGQSAIHIVGVTAVWVIFLCAIQFAIVGGHGLKPLAECVWHIAWARHATWIDRRRWFVASLDTQYAEMVIALTTRWSGVMLFGGVVLIGWGLAMGSIGDVAQLVANTPKSWETFDRTADLAGAVLLAAGMASVQAAITRRRSLSLLASIGFALMGVGIGAVTAVHA